MGGDPGRFESSEYCQAITLGLAVAQIRARLCSQDIIEGTSERRGAGKKRKERQSNFPGRGGETLPGNSKRNSSTIDFAKLKLARG